MFGLNKPARPRVVAFDIIGTVFPLEPLRAGIVALGLPPSALEGWFAAGLRDSFALAAAGDFKPFPAILEQALKQVLSEQKLDAPEKQQAAFLEQLNELPPRLDAQEAFTLLQEAGIRIVALTNGSKSSAETLLKDGRLYEAVNHIVSVDEVKLSKPRQEVYLHAAKKAGVEPTEMALVAAHGWDVNGAKAAGLVTAYLAAECPFPSTMRSPDLQDTSLSDLARTISRL